MRQGDDPARTLRHPRRGRRSGAVPRLAARRLRDRTRRARHRRQLHVGDPGESTLPVEIPALTARRRCGTRNGIRARAGDVDAATVGAAGDAPRTDGERRVRRYRRPHPHANASAPAAGCGRGIPAILQPRARIRPAPDLPHRQRSSRGASLRHARERRVVSASSTTACDRTSSSGGRTRRRRGARPAPTSSRPICAPSTARRSRASTCRCRATCPRSASASPPPASPASRPTSASPTATSSTAICAARIAIDGAWQPDGRARAASTAIPSSRRPTSSPPLRVLSLDIETDPRARPLCSHRPRRPRRRSRADRRPRSAAAAPSASRRARAARSASSRCSTSSIPTS